MALRDVVSFPLPLVESGQKYAPAELAYEIRNMRLTPDGVMESVRGPAPIIPDYGSGYPWGGRVHGVFHAKLDNGTRDVTLVRAGSVLYEQTGWKIASSPTTSLATGLSSDPNARWPDQFVEVAGKIVWNNSVDAARIYDGYIFLELGYDRAPGAPTATGPGDTGHPVFRNKNGYSHPGQIGTVGNFYTQQSGALLEGRWFYYVQFEDVFGNRSAISPASSVVVLRQELTQSSYWLDYDNYPGATLFDQSLGLLSVNLDDLTKQFLVTDIPEGPQGTVKVLLGRSVDTARGPNTPRLLTVLPSNKTRVFPDNTPDAALGAPLIDYIPIPHFHAMCAHNGCLVILDETTLRISDPGFPGSFRRERYLSISGGTGVFSYAGKLYVATGTSIAIVDTGDFLTSRTVSEGHGLVGPNAFASTPLGVGVGLGYDGFWSLDNEGNLTPISREEYHLFRSWNVAMLPLAAAVWSPLDQEFLCAVPDAGAFGNNLVMAWDGRGWRRRRYGLTLSSLCVTKDWRRYVLAGGRRISDGENNAWSLHGEVSTYTPPTKTYLYRSQWLRGDPLGAKRFNVDHLYIGIVETSRADITYTVWQNGSRDESVVSGTIEGVNPATTDVLNTLVLGTGRLRNPRLTWKRMDVRVKSAECFAFDLSCEEPTYMSIVAFAFDKVDVDPRMARVSRQ